MYISSRILALKKPLPIQITIPKPCSEDWDKMAPNELGRFCAHCQRTVIDFTGWSDTALYQFIVQNRGTKTCGQFLITQLNRNICLPPQPHSKLYRIFIGLGLTLLLTQVPIQKTFAKAPFAIENTWLINDEDSGNDSIIIKGKVTNGKEIVPDASIYVYHNDTTFITGASTDRFGSYEIKIKNSGKYHLVAEGFDMKGELNIDINTHKVYTVDIKIQELPYVRSKSLEQSFRGDMAEIPITHDKVPSIK